ncbi:hypothetical protein [Asanoa siamensis]|uniref:Uncharacterized protein n=1 Tax=Asanoa siamensis TaxID=926357 RepID=A0ABQ4CWY8_9ACTN|nr:hypothetical protein [Asanoa siamensis]GIF75808.1 hypothetical protein Asi02nite_53260 [Asanoa siamensis]
MAIPPVSFGQGSAIWNWHADVPLAPSVIMRALTVVTGCAVVPMGDDDPPVDAVLCDVWRGDGEFPVAIDCYGPPSEVTEPAAAAEVASLLRCRILLADDTLIPDRHVLATADGTLRPVHVDVSETDDGAALSNPRPCTGHDPWCSRWRVPCQQSWWTPDRVVPGLAA